MYLPLEQLIKQGAAATAPTAPSSTPARTGADSTTTPPRPDTTRSAPVRTGSGR